LENQVFLFQKMSNSKINSTHHLPKVIWRNCT